ARARSASAVTLWARDPLQAQAMNATRENQRYLPGVSLAPAISIVSDLRIAIRDAGLIVVATPIAALTELVSRLIGLSAAPLVWVGKGFVANAASQGGIALAHQVVAPRWSSTVGVISGPSFAEEVALGLPTAVSIAATASKLANAVAERL